MKASLYPLIIRYTPSLCLLPQLLIMYRFLAGSLLFALSSALPSNNTTTAEYEYVVIGSGPGGGPLA